jgi:hypothetical protein
MSRRLRFGTPSVWRRQAGRHDVCHPCTCYPQTCVCLIFALLLHDRSHQMGLQRLAALRFLAALASRLGGPAVGPYLPLMLRPLYRITEAASGNPEEVRFAVSCSTMVEDRCPTCIGLRQARYSVSVLHSACAAPVTRSTATCEDWSILWCSRPSAFSLKPQ